MTYRSIQCFANDSNLDEDELRKICEIAEKDGLIDTNEIRVSASIIFKIKLHEVDAAMQQRLAEISKHNYSPPLEGIGDNS